jgi:hypothetical protein
MAIEKVLNTRIQLKYDKYENWVSENPTLKAGEVAIAYLASAHTSTSPDNGTHAVMFKVGPGAFNTLPWTSALAADVYSWAKQSSTDFAANFLSMADANGETMQTKLDNLFATPAEVKAAIDKFQTDILNGVSGRVEAIEKDYLKAADKTELEGKITSEANRADTEEKRIVGLVEGLDGRIDTLEGHVGDSTKGLLKDVADLKTAVGEGGSVDSKIANAIADLDAEKSQAAGADGLALSITEVDGKITAISGSIAAETYDAYGAAAAAQSAAEKTASDALAAARTEISAEIDGDVKTAKEALETQINNITNADNGILAQAKKYTDDEVKELADGAVKANTEAIAAINKADTGILAQAKAYTDDVKEAILGEGISETFDTLVEIQKWIEGDGVNATELTKAIADETTRAKAAEDKIATFGEDGKLNGGALFTEVNGLQDQIDDLGIVDGKVEAAVNADEAAHADVASELDETGIAQVQGIKVNNATNAETANHLAESAKEEVKAVKVDNATHADAAAKVDNALTIKTEDGTEVVYDGSAIKSVDLTGLATKAYADQAEADAKTYADGLADNYATAAQGAKADSAVQKVTVLGKELTDGGSVSVDEAKTALGLGTAAYKAEGDFATAAQGAKADTALQEITTTENGGLKVTNKNKIDIDESVVFVFDCGSATKNID